MGISDVMFEKMKKMHNERNSIETKISYINWLSNYLENHNLITTEKIVFEYKFLSEEDYYNLSNISLFYGLIKKYANVNNIQPIIFGNECFYIIKIDNNLYRLGAYVLDRTYFYCEKYEEKTNLIPYIDINEIINNALTESKPKVLKKI